VKRSSLAALKDQLVDRDYVLLESVEKYRLLTTKQIQRLHFNRMHPTPVAAARACTRTLTRLRDLGVLRELQRRIGGVRAGSAGYVWYIGPAGERLRHDRHPEARSARRNYREPSRYFVDHTLAVTELAVQAIEADRAGDIKVLTVEAEPDSWQPSLSPQGTAQWLKPDLRLVTATSAEEIHHFIEVDMATEHLPVIVRQCQAYQAFRASGRYQAAHGLFPAVLWVVPTEPRAVALRAAVAATAGKPRAASLDPELFSVCTQEEYLARICDEEQPPEEDGGQEGGTPS
jgi:hypothetical protein